MIEEKGLYPITILCLSKKELIAFSKVNFMIAKDILGEDLMKLSHKTDIPYTRLQRLQSLVRRILS